MFHIKKGRYNLSSKRDKRYEYVLKVVGEKWYIGGLYYRVMFKDEPDDKPCINWVKFMANENGEEEIAGNLKRNISAVNNWVNSRMTLEKFKEVVTEDTYKSVINKIHTSHKKKKDTSEIDFESDEYNYNTPNRILTFAIELINKYYYQGIDIMGIKYLSGSTQTRSKITSQLNTTYYVDMDDLTYTYYPMSIQLVLEYHNVR